MKAKIIDSAHELFDAEPGSYAKGNVQSGGQNFTVWWFKCPRCHGLGTLSYDTRKGQIHEVDEHDDGTISVQRKRQGQPDENSNSILHDCGWHGYIDHGEWQEI